MIVHTLVDMERAVIEVREAKTGEACYEIISRLLHGRIDYSNPQGKTLGSRRAIFCSRISQEKLWPERG